MGMITSPYVFGHFEFPFFMMNAVIAMPDDGKLNMHAFKQDHQRVFSGHFHRRQKQINQYGATIEYIGNCFPHNYSDAGDDDRGIMLLELGKEPIYKAWPDAPKYRTLTLNELLEDPGKHLDEKTSARITVDADISYEEATFIRDTMNHEYKPRDLSFIPYKQQLEDVQFNSDINFVSVEQIVIDQLKSIESETLDSSLLIRLYNDL